MRHRLLVFAVVGAMLLLIMGGAVWVLRQARERVRYNYSRDYLEMAAEDVEKFRETMGCYPSASEFADATKFTYQNAEVQSDLWGRPFLYESQTCDRFTLRCLGRDGQPGGSGADADMTITEATEGRASFLP